MFVIEENIDVKCVLEAKKALLSAIDAQEGGRFAFDLSGPEPSQIALQLGLAALKELDARAIEPAPGKHMADLVDSDAAQLENRIMP